MRVWIVGWLALALAACASSSTRERPSDYRDGLGPDLRVFSDDLCLNERDTRGAGLLGEVVKGVAGLALKSFGRFLEEVGSPEIETASGVHAGLFFDASSKPPVLNPELRCIYIVRDGFQSKRFDAKAPAELKETWTRLGVKGTPSLYAMVRLDPAEDRTNHFNATLLEFTAQRFARAGAEVGRDYVLVLEFVVPSGGRQYKINANGEIVFESSGPFARGGFPLRGVQRGAYMRSADLKGLETGWLTGPPNADGSGQRPINLYVDVVELKRGNPFIADLGRFLQSSEVTKAAGEEALGIVDQEQKQRAEVDARVGAEKTERNLVHGLEGDLLALRTALADRSKPKTALLQAVQDAESASSDIELQRLQKGWVTPWPEALLAEAKRLIDDGRRAVEAQ